MFPRLLKRVLSLFVYLLLLITFVTLCAECYEGEWLKVKDEGMFPENCVKANIGDSYVVFSDYGSCEEDENCAAFGHAYNISSINSVYAYFAYDDMEIGTKYKVKPEEYEMLQYDGNIEEKGYAYQWVNFEDFIEDPVMCEPLERYGYLVVNYLVKDIEWIIGKYRVDNSIGEFVRDGKVYSYHKNELKTGYILCTQYQGYRNFELVKISEVNENMFHEKSEYFIFGSFENSESTSKANRIDREYVDKWGEDYGYNEGWRADIPTHYEGSDKIADVIYGKIWNNVHGAYSAGDNQVREVVRTYVETVDVPPESTITFSVVIYHGTLEIPYEAVETVLSNTNAIIVTRTVNGTWVGHTTFIGELFLGVPVSISTYSESLDNVENIAV